jgi:opacity protein-like surface antigen
MGRVTVMLIAGAATLLSIPAASAADLPVAPPLRPVIQEFSGWYLRGDIGMSNQSVGSLDNYSYHTAGTTVTSINKSFDSAPFFGLGVGYQFNNWLRADLTGEYRAKANFHGSDNGTFADGGTGRITDTYTGSKSEWVVMGNLYADLGTWWGITPFIGAGIGAAYNTISGFQDTGIGVHSAAWAAANPTLDPKINSVWYAGESGKWNFAWAVHAGLAYRVTPGFTVELAYRYLDLGKAQTANTYPYDYSTVGHPFYFNNLTSHDVKLGLRWMLWEPEPAYPPLVRKG